MPEAAPKEGSKCPVTGFKVTQPEGASFSRGRWIISCCDQQNNPFPKALPDV